MKIKLSIAVTTMLLGTLSNLQAAPFPSEFNINQSTGNSTIVSANYGDTPISVINNSLDQVLTIDNGAYFFTQSRNALNINNSKNFIIINNGDLRTKSGSIIFVNKGSKVSITNNNYIAFTMYTDPVKAIENNGDMDLFNSSTGIVWGDIINNSDMSIYNEGEIGGNITNNSQMNIYNKKMINGSITNAKNATLEYTSDENSNLTGSIINNGKLNFQSHMKDELNGVTIENSGSVNLTLTNNIIREYVGEKDSVLTFNFITRGPNEPDGTNHSKLTGRTITFKDGSSINIDVTKDSTNVDYLANKSYKIIQASDKLDVQGKLNVTDNSALLNFRTDYTSGNELSVVADINKTVSEAVNTQNNLQRTATVIDTIISNPNLYPEMNSFISRLNTLSTNEQVDKAVESTTPVNANASLTASNQIISNVGSVISQRQSANISGSGMNSGDIFTDSFSDNNLWIKTFGSIGSQSNKSDINGFDLKSFGLGFGIDTKYKSDKTFGLGFFYTNADIDVNNMNQSTDVDAFTAVIYGTTPIIDDKTNLLYQVGYTLQKNDSYRGMALINQRAEADYTSKVANIDLKLQRDFEINSDLLFQPYVNTTYRHITNPSYTENGAGGLNLKVDRFTTSELILGLGTDVSYNLDKYSKLTANAGVGYDLQDKEQVISSSYSGAPGLSFKTNGIDNGRYNYDLGIGYSRDLNKSNNISLNYNYQGEGSSFRNNVISAKYIYNF
ncbi:autotransporter domain-containing protein [Aliarcobacter butzleri]|uniref:autotransporter family protein n=1 Tax=Aliarcobacter butzleri TaxID=28197 RepID=UPI0021B3D325|nr:autotransporter outer membrane beta-barrel domain-containing protein [Aliarcobacter butzleri]MCT7635860.1 autotransporter domain-containing protein [Aliarcobacter butzleri]